MNTKLDTKIDTQPGSKPDSKNKVPLKERLSALVSEYGPVALGTYFVVFGLTLVGFAVAIRMGFEIDGAAGTATTLGAAYVATKVIQPLRIVATFALTPLVARVIRSSRQAAPPKSGD